MMSDMIPHAAIELVVAKIYTESAGKSTAFVNAPPATAAAGFIRFLHLISTHDWVRYVAFSSMYLHRLELELIVFDLSLVWH